MTLRRTGKPAGLGFDRITIISTFPAETEEGEETMFHLVDTDEGLAVLAAEVLAAAVEQGAYQPL